MKYGNILATSFVICLCTALVVIFAFLRPEQTLYIVTTYLSTIIIMSIFMYIVEKIYTKHKTSVDTEDFVKVAENLNIEFILWQDDFEFISINKRLRDEMEVDSDFDEKEVFKRAFGLEELTKENIKPIVGGFAYESAFQNSSGKIVSITWSTSIVKKIKKKNIYVSTGFNLTEIKKMRTNLASANDFFNASMELAEIGVIMSTDRTNYILSSEVVRFFELKTNRITKNKFKEHIHRDDRMLFESALKYDGQEVRSIELRIKPLNKNTYRWYSFRYRTIKGTENTLPLFGGAILDSTKEHEKDSTIERLAYIDEVTEIPNRNKLMKIGQEIYECCEPLNCSYWIMVLDIDRFHIINDSCGYVKGNYLLKNFAHILYKFVNSGGIAARISGDNFALILKDYGDDELPVRTAKIIQEEFAKLAVGEFNSINLSCSVGFSKMPDDGDSFLGVMEHAEFALKSVSGQNEVCGYEPSMHDSIIGNTELEKALALAIDNNELQLFYQPKIDLQTNKIMGVEALIRWIKPDGTIVTPNAFVPIAESSRLIGKISEFVLNEGCRQNILWQKMGYPNIVMSINFTSTDFYQADLKEKVFEALAKSGLDPEWLEIELTETLALSDIDYAVSQMNKLRELGVKLAMDDFGTGYSSLSYLQILPITLLKLDRSFIINIQHDNIDFEIVSSVINIAKSKKIKTIAEGIENPEQEEILRKAGCDYGQGYLYGKPMPAEKLEEFMEKFI